MLSQLLFLFAVLISTILSSSPFMCSSGLSNLLFLLSNMIFTQIIVLVSFDPFFFYIFQFLKFSLCFSILISVRILMTIILNFLSSKLVISVSLDSPLPHLRFYLVLQFASRVHVLFSVTDFNHLKSKQPTISSRVIQGSRREYSVYSDTTDSNSIQTKLLKSSKVTKAFLH